MAGLQFEWTQYYQTRKYIVVICIRKATNKCKPDKLETSCTMVHPHTPFFSTSGHQISEERMTTIGNKYLIQMFYLRPRPKDYFADAQLRLQLTLGRPLRSNTRLQKRPEYGNNGLLDIDWTWILLLKHFSSFRGMLSKRSMLTRTVTTM